jgi:hypothetical protein
MTLCDSDSITHSGDRCRRRPPGPFEKKVDEWREAFHNPSMQYRRFPQIDREISALGLGCMRLPTLGQDAAAIDEAVFDAMLHAAADAGVTYVDTAYGYHKGMSEVALGAALDRTGLRGRFTLTTKSPVWLIRDKGDWERILDEQLARLKTDHVDFYLFHALGTERWQTVLRLGGLEAFERFRKDGRIGHIGFSFHDSIASFKTIIDDYPSWELCQVQYNYVDRDYQAGEAGLAYAAEREIGVVVMEPLRGGALASPMPAVRAALARWPTPRMPAEWGLRFALDRQEVVTVLSGMCSVNQVWENAAVADGARVNSLTRGEREVIEAARKIYKSRELVPCTSCGYCQPCPSSVAIPDIFDIYNAASMFDARKERSSWYRVGYLGDGKGVDRCTRCGVCVTKCPQGIAIPDHLVEAHDYLMKES